MLWHVKDSLLDFSVNCCGQVHFLRHKVTSDVLSLVRKVLAIVVRVFRKCNYTG